VVQGQRGIVLAIYRQPGTNTIEVVDAVKKTAPHVPRRSSGRGQYQRDVRPVDTIRESVEDVQFSLILALALVVMVIFMFLRNIPATIIPTVALPSRSSARSRSCTCSATAWTTSPLMALTLCVGFVWTTRS